MIKRPQKLYDYEENWALHLEALLNKLRDSDYRLEELTIEEDFSAIGLVGYTLFQALDLYKKLVELHHNYNADEEVIKFKKEQKAYVNNELNKIFSKQTQQ